MTVVVCLCAMCVCVFTCVCVPAPVQLYIDKFDTLDEHLLDGLTTTLKAWAKGVEVCSHTPLCFPWLKLGCV